MSHVDDVTVTAILSVLPIPRARNGYPYRVRTPENLHILDANSVPIRVKYVSCGDWHHEGLQSKCQ
jgi:hypothetical protein